VSQVMRSKVADPVGYLAGLGHLHDAVIVGAQFDSDEHRFSLEVDDLNSNLQGLPEYPGLLPATIVFDGVRNLVLRELEKLELHGSIYRLTCSASETAHAQEACDVDLKIWPSGAVEFSCRAVFVEIDASAH